MIYIKEAHPKDGWVLEGNERRGISFKDPKTLDERVDIAKQACVAMKINMPSLVDTIDDTVNKAYAAWPDRVFVVNERGRIAVMAKHGPWGFDPGIKRTRYWLIRNHNRKIFAK